MYNDTITLFNRETTSDGSVIWHPTVIRNADFNADRAKISATYGERCDDLAKLHVVYATRGDALIIGGKTYLLPKEWQALSSASKRNYLTFTSGKDFDFFWHGEWSGGEAIADSGYTDGFYEYMCLAHDDVYKISQASLYSVIPHFEILGR